MELFEAGNVVSCDVLVAQPQPEAGKRIRLGNALLLTDFSASSELALPFAAALARQYGGKVYVVHVISPEMYEYLPPTFVPQMRTEIRSIRAKRNSRSGNAISTSS